MKAGAYEYEEDGEKGGANKKPNGLPIWGNEKSMNLNPLILTNIQSSQYFKVNLYQLKTYHEVIDEIYYNVSHLEPWEKGSRKTSGQTGMCGGVRGVGAGGIVSTAFCILYKLYTLRLTRKQVTGLLNHSDSPYIRGLGFMYIRYTQPPADLWDWFEGYLDDEEEIDVRAGGGQSITIGQVVRHMLTKLDWYSTLFPRIPVPIQKDLEKKLGDRAASRPAVAPVPAKPERYAGRAENEPVAKEVTRTYEAENKEYNSRERGSARERGERDHERERDRGERERDHERERGKERDHDKEKERDSEKRREKSREKSRDYPREKNGDCDRGRDRHRERDRDHHDRHRNRDKDRRRSRSRSHDRKHRHHHDRYNEERSHRGDYADLLEREKYRIKKEKKSDSSRDHHHRSRSRSRDRDRRHRH